VTQRSYIWPYRASLPTPPTATDDEPLTDIERAVVRALVSVLVREIREEEARRAEARREP
jgi:hypothetical protein